MRSHFYQAQTGNVHIEELDEVLTAFSKGLSLITVSELGDKTFFIAVILAMRHSRRIVFAGVLAALTAMTIISVLVGQVASLLPAKYVHYSEIILFIGFGIKLLYSASQMPKDSCDVEVVQEATEAVEKAELKLSKQQIATAIYLEAFILTFIAEWGDRTQIATIALSAANSPVGVTIGAIIGHAICTAIAVIGGRMLTGRISERNLTFAGGGLFLVFGILSLFEKM